MNEYFELLPVLDDEQIKKDVIEEDDIIENDPIEEIEEEEIEEEKIEEEDIEDDTATIFYESLVEKGILPKDIEIKNWNDLDSAIDNLPNIVKENVINSVSVDAKPLLDYILTKGNSLTKDELKEFYDDYLNEFSEYSDPNEARSFLKQKFSEQFDEDTVEIMLDSLEDKNQLVDKANILRDKPAEQKLQQTKEEIKVKEQEQQLFVKTIVSEFDSLPWQEKQKEKVKTQLFNGETEQLIQKIASDPKSLIQLANILSYYNEKDKLFDLDTFIIKANTPTNNSLKDKIKSTMGSNQRSAKPVKTKEELIPVL